LLMLWRKMLNKTIVEASGAYAIPRQGRSSWLIEVPEEDYKPQKLESLSDVELMRPIIQGMFGVVSGKIENDETPQEALAREFFEEQGLVIPSSALTNSLPSPDVWQMRGDKVVKIKAHGHSFTIFNSEIDQITQRVRVQRVDDDQLEVYLRDNWQIIRPAIHGILTLVLQELKSGKEI